MATWRLTYPLENKGRRGDWRVLIDGSLKRKRFKTYKAADRWANEAVGYQAVVYREDKR